MSEVAEKNLFAAATGQTRNACPVNEATVRQLVAEREAETKRRQALERRVAELVEMIDKRDTALRETREALEFVIGDHNIPGDCYSTGPVTGTPLDAVCPSCSGIRVLARHAELAGEEVPRG